MTWSESGVIILALLLVLTWFASVLDHQGIDNHIDTLRRHTNVDLPSRMNDVELTANIASRKASEARMEAMKAHERLGAQIEAWNEVGLTALKAASNAKRAHGRLDDIHCTAIDLVHGHEQAFHPNEVKRLELQKQNQETEAQAARKAINPELI